MKIQLQSLMLSTLNKDDKNALSFYKKIKMDETITSRVQGISVGLLNNTNNELFDHSFLVSTIAGEYFGYIKIGAYNALEKSVYLRGAIDKDQRQKGYGTTMLLEVCDFIFKNYLEVESIRLKIVHDNIASLRNAAACGFTWLNEDYYIKYNPYLNIKNINTLK